MSDPIRSESHTFSKYSYGAMKHAANVYKTQPGRIEDYQPGHSSIAQKETQQVSLLFFFRFILVG